MSNNNKINHYVTRIVSRVYYEDLSEADKFFDIAESELNPEQFVILLEEVKRDLEIKVQLPNLRALLRTAPRYLEKIEQKIHVAKEKAGEYTIQQEQARIYTERQAQEEVNRKEQRRIERENAIAPLKKCFETDFLSADGLYESSFSNVLSRDSYKTEKKLFVKNWFLKNSQSSNTQPDDEQLVAISSLNENVLLKARAGSGKTSVVTDRARFLISHCGIHPDEVMLLAFNTDAAGEMAERIRKKCDLAEYKNARTFHSLASELAKSSKKILYDKKTETGEQSNFVYKLISNKKNPFFWAGMYQFFRTEMGEMKISKDFLSQEEYLTYRRNHRELTLSGDNVKSMGEKYIGDFLFEHNLTHRYEDVVFSGKQTWYPDFTIFLGSKNIFSNSKKRKIVIEHWGIDENDSTQQAPAEWTITWQQYKKRMVEKRAFWQSSEGKKRANFVETSISDLKLGRENFENILKQKLVDIKIPLKKLSNKELYKKIEDKRVAKISRMFLKFIQQAKKQELSPDDLIEKINKIDTANKKVKTFAKVANKVYRKYEKKLVDKNAMDFDDLIKVATNKIHEENGNSEVKTANGCSIKINQIKYLMIDEYQDFTPLFFGLVNSIRRYNPDLKIFCVGDDWQAINAFAGSDLKYFHHFEEYVDRSEHLSLLTNYRSTKNIVDISNDFMDGKGDKSRPDKNNAGKIYKCYTDKVFIERRQDLEYEESRKFDERFCTKVNGENKDASLTVGRALKSCHSVITQEENISKKIAIMSRKQKLKGYYYTLSKFKEKLKETCRGLAVYKDFDKNITVGTTHSFKGLEADIVIMLFVNQGEYPLIHPDNELYEVFGSTLADSLYEEQRLFYVGMTRAKEDLYILCEEYCESDFLKNMNLQKIRVNRNCRISFDGQYRMQSVYDVF